MTSYNLRSVLASKEFRDLVESLHRDYYEEWRRETDLRTRELLAAKADVLDDVIAVILNTAGDSNADE